MFNGFIKAMLKVKKQALSGYGSPIWMVFLRRKRAGAACAADPHEHVG